MPHKLRRTLTLLCRNNNSINNNNRNKCPSLSLKGNPLANNHLDFFVHSIALGLSVPFRRRLPPPPPPPLQSLCFGVLAVSRLPSPTITARVFDAMVSAVAIVNAKRVWRGGSAVEMSAESSYPNGVDAVLIRDGVIDFVGSTADVMQRYASAQQEISSSTSGATSTAVLGGRPRAPFCRVIDCHHRRAVYPGFMDSHVHFMDGGRHLLAPQLDFANGREQFVENLKAFVAHHYDGAGGWIFGGGWSEAVLGCWPSREWLDAVSPTIPMVMYSKDVHSCVMNEAALRCCHIIPGAADTDPLITEVEGGRIERDANGVPTGVLRDNAMNVAKRYLPTTDSFASKVAALQAAEQYFLSLGFTSVFSMMSTRYTDNVAEMAFLRQMEQEGKLRVRVRYGAPIEALSGLLEQFWQPVAAAVESKSRPHDDFTLPFRFTCVPPERGGGYLVLGAVKLFSDGSLSSQTAAMNRPFNREVRTDGDLDSDLDDAAIAAFLLSKADGDVGKCQCGLLTMPRMELRAAVHRAHSHNLQLCLHAIGDRAVATVNKVLQESSDWLKTQTTPQTDAVVAAFQQSPRSRVEHCQHVSNVSKEVSRMGACGIIASMQPCHLLFDGDYVDALLGEKRKATSYIWGTFLRNGIRVALGSDWPVAPADVNDGLRGAVTRVPDVMSTLAAEQQTGGGSAEGKAALKRYHDVWNESECIAMDAALRTYTYESAYGAFMENQTGTIEVGKWADVTVWSDDFLEPVVPLNVGREGPRWWPRGQEPRVDFTIVGGIIEYERATTNGVA